MDGDKAGEVVPACGAVVSLGSSAEALHATIVVIRGKHHVDVRVDLGGTRMEECVPGKVWVAGGE